MHKLCTGTPHFDLQQSDGQSGEHNLERTSNVTYASYAHGPKKYGEIYELLRFLLCHYKFSFRKMRILYNSPQLNLKQDALYCICLYLISPLFPRQLVSRLSDIAPDMLRFA